MCKRRLQKVLGLTVLGFILPNFFRMPIAYFNGEWSDLRSDFRIFLTYFAPSIAGAIFFFLAALTSTTQQPRLTFVQSLAAHVVAFFVSAVLALTAFGPSPLKSMRHEASIFGALLPFLTVLFVTICLLASSGRAVSNSSQSNSNSCT